MNKYGFDVMMKDPQLVAWAQAVNERNDRKAKESRDNMMNTMKMLGLAGAAYKGNPMMEQSAEDYYNNTWADYTPEDQVALASMGFNPNLNTGRLKLNDDDVWATNVWGM